LAWMGFVGVGSKYADCHQKYYKRCYEILAPIVKVPVGE